MKPDPFPRNIHPRGKGSDVFFQPDRAAVPKGRARYERRVPGDDRPDRALNSPSSEPLSHPRWAAAHPSSAYSSSSQISYTAWSMALSAGLSANIQPVKIRSILPARLTWSTSTNTLVRCVSGRRPRVAGPRRDLQRARTAPSRRHDDIERGDPAGDLVEPGELRHRIGNRLRQGRHSQHQACGDSDKCPVEHGETPCDGRRLIPATRRRSRR